MCAPSAPPPPDYAGAAVAQGEANLKAGQQSTLLNNPNIVNPYGTQTYDPGPDVFDQAGFDAATAKYNTDLTAFQTPLPQSVDNDTGEFYTSGDRGTAPTAVNRADYTTPSLRGTVTQTFSPEQQALYDKSVESKGLMADLGIQGAQSLQGVVGKNLDFSSLSPSGRALDVSSLSPSGRALDVSSLSPSGRALDVSSLSPQGEAFQSRSAEGTRQSVIDAMMSRADTRLGQQAEQTNADLVARGLRPGTEAYTREQDALGRQRNDAFQQAQIAGGDAAAQQNSQDLALQGQRFGQMDANRRQQIAEMLTQRQTPLNEISALMSGSQVSNPFAGGLGFQGGANVGATPTANATQQQGVWDQNQYAQKVGQNNAVLSGLFSLGGAAFGA